MSKHRETDSGFCNGIYLKVQELHRVALRAVDELKDELEEERRKSASGSAYALGFRDGKTESSTVYVAEPEGIARAQGRKFERERIIALIRERINSHGYPHNHHRCEACVESHAIITILERGE